MSLAAEGLAKWRNDKRRNTVQWFRKHPGSALFAIGAQRAGTSAWEGTARTASSIGAGLREYADQHRKQSSTQTMPDGHEAHEGISVAARSTGSPAGMALIKSADVLVTEAEMLRDVKRATETVATLQGLMVGVGTYAEAMQFFAEMLQARKTDPKAVKEARHLADEFLNLADDFKRAHKVIDKLYAAQQDQEEQTGTAMQ